MGITIAFPLMPVIDFEMLQAQSLTTQKNVASLSLFRFLSTLFSSTCFAVDLYQLSVDERVDSARLFVSSKFWNGGKSCRLVRSR